jgi:hypothetical protein
LCHIFRLKREVYSVVRVVRTWYPIWLASYDFSKLFNGINSDIFVKKLRKYIEDRRLISQITTLLKMQTINVMMVVYKNPLTVPQGNLILLLLFNFYVHSLDKFVEKTAKSVIEIGNTRGRLLYPRIKRLCLNTIKQLPIKVNCFMIKKHAKLKRKKMSMQVYYVRCNYNFLIGFLMSKAQSKRIVEDIYKHIKDKLQFGITKKLLRYTFSDKVKFLGFEIQPIPIETSKYSKNKKLEVYKRNQNKNFRKGAQDYVQFLKAAE